MKNENGRERRPVLFSWQCESSVLHKIALLDSDQEESKEELEDVAVYTDR
jgi:hypothetical protein